MRPDRQAHASQYRRLSMDLLLESAGAERWFALDLPHGQASAPPQRPHGQAFVMPSFGCSSAPVRASQLVRLLLAWGKSALTFPAAAPAALPVLPQADRLASARQLQTSVAPGSPARRVQIHSPFLES